MATGNFYNRNANSIFAIEIENDWDYDDLKDNLKSIFKNNHLYSWFSKDDVEPNYNRSYPGTLLGTLYEDVDVSGLKANINVDIIIRSGYYSGVNLDWDLEIEVGYDTLQSVDDITIDMICEDEFERQYFESFKKECENVKERMIEYIEKVYSENSIALGVTARFSNGETIYHKL